MDLAQLGRLLLVLAGALAIFGLAMLLLVRLGSPLVPGDVSIRLGNVRVFIPIGTSILLSLILTLILNLLVRR